MYRILTASKDSYITNKIIDNSFRATDANVGKAATLDLFKLYAESTSGSDTSPTELSRALVKFDLNALRRITGSFLDIGHSSFKCTLKLIDVYGGQTCPSNFKLIVFPLSKSFDEGIGRDIVRFSDLDTCNWLTSSISNSTTAETWSLGGANKHGLLGSTNIDIIASGNLKDGNGVSQIWKEQIFSTGEEDLSVDVTTIISATLKNIIPDHGLRISYTGSEETDSVTRFVKRFGSTNSSNPSLRPRLIVEYNEAIQDHHRSFYFNLSGSLFLNNFHRGFSANMLSGSSATQITGSNSIILEIKSGSTSRGTYFSKIITGSQHKVGTNFITGVYSASFAVSQWASGTIHKEIKNAGSATFKEIWSSLDRSVGFLTSSFVVKSVQRSSFSNQPKRLLASITNLQHEYSKNSKIKIRVFVEDVDRPVVYKKVPFVNDGEIFTSMYYRILDSMTGDVVIPYGTDGSTLLSTDSDGMYFEFYVDSLHKGRSYRFEFLVKDMGVDQYFDNVASSFSVI